MGFLRKLFGKKDANVVKLSTPTPNESLDDRIKRLWEDAMKFTFVSNRKDVEIALGIYTELLTLVDEQSSNHNVCAILRNRAITYRKINNFDAALEDLTSELEIAKSLGYQQRIMECHRIIGETKADKRKEQILSDGGKKASKFKKMEKQAQKLWNTGPDFNKAFFSLFADLENNDTEVRAEASRLLEDSENALRKLVAIYQDLIDSDPYRASLAGRVLGRRLTRGSEESLVHSQRVQKIYGISASFIPCSCIHCGQLNSGIASLKYGAEVPYYHQVENKGAYTIPVLCDGCGKQFFVVWDVIPTDRPNFIRVPIEDMEDLHKYFDTPISQRSGNLFWFAIKDVSSEGYLEIQRLLYSLFIPNPPLLSPKTTKGVKEFSDELSFYEGIIKPKIIERIPCMDDQQYVKSVASNRCSSNKILVIGIHGDREWQKKRHAEISRAVNHSYKIDTEGKEFQLVEYLGMTTFVKRKKDDPRLVKMEGSLHAFDGNARGVGLRRTLTLNSSLVRKHYFENIFTDAWFFDRGYRIIQ